jgi:hypothetical protein
MALGLGTDRPNARQAAVYRLVSSAFIGLPCPKKIAGIRVAITTLLVTPGVSL